MFILTADEIMERGLELMGYDQHRQLKVKRARSYSAGLMALILLSMPQFYKTFRQQKSKKPALTPKSSILTIF